MKKRQNILVVEDDLNTQILYKALLSDEFELFICDSVSIAKEYLKKNNIEIVILDLAIKGENDGLVLARYIRANNKWNNVNILAVTAHVLIFDKERCLEAGCDKFITKPIRGNKLLKHIENILSS